MTDASDRFDESSEPTLYAATLAPHRSLQRRGFLIVMALVSAVSLVCGTAFLLMGAWPVFGVFGLDVLLLWIAFRLNFRDAQAREEITLTPSLLTVRKVAPSGAARQTQMNPQWTRLHADRHEEFGILRVTLLARGGATEVGGFLYPQAKEELVSGLSGALAQAKRGVVRSHI
ncbi:MAG TPA: DUF2244 domain-containing protein [Xanthobacteraceae bacterium]|nr:DUF2244 domain-containing protein [Xanthobacteraceae bacterium]